MNRLVVDRQPLLLLVSAITLLPIVIHGRDVRALPARLPELVRRRLQRLYLPGEWIDAEVAAMAPVAVSKTASRSVLGVMNDFAYRIPYHLSRGWDEMSLTFLADQLAETPIFASGPTDGVVVPQEATPQRMSARWEQHIRPPDLRLM
ncbi:MAG: hypothetical protein V4813_09905 [Gemmatimonadota bacterium]